MTSRRVYSCMNLALSLPGLAGTFRQAFLDVSSHPLPLLGFFSEPLLESSSPPGEARKHDGLRAFLLSLVSHLEV